MNRAIETRWSTLVPLGRVASQIKKIVTIPREVLISAHFRTFQPRSQLTFPLQSAGKKA